MTEASPVTHWLPFYSKKYGSCGGPLPGTESAIVSLETCERLGPGQAGEILVRGPQVMKGYYKNPEATSLAIDSDGWLHTGDVGKYDQDGFFTVIDRIKELIKVKGLQVLTIELALWFLVLQS